ncbi:DUF1800 domain-containing protein [Kribbella sp. CA-247076]|uniref:DUF1800 domain-containing protein n=1 Tax=Kribbella sp. CA-247076 TaxID=3239941 RepID=UPI003D93B312
MVLGLTAASTVAAGGLVVDVLKRPQLAADAMPSSPINGGTAAKPAPRPKPAGQRISAVRQPATVTSKTDRDASYTATDKPRKASTQGTYPSFAAAAKAGRTTAGILVPKAGRLTTAQAKRHLLNRVTFGPRPGDVEDLDRLGIDRWLTQQLSPTMTDPSGNQAWAAFPLAGAAPSTIHGAVKKYSWDAMFETGFATLGRQIYGRRQLFEVVVDVFSNHLHVPTPSDRGWDTAPQYATAVIRKHAFGGFSDMLKAAMRHPAMLRFLDNDQSTRESVNENLGRELLELHTVGVASGYTENDVRASAYILSGRGADEAGKFEYAADRHRPGRVKVLDFSAANGSGSGGLSLGDRYLTYLANHPATAATIARKLAVRFVSDTPSKALVAGLAKVYLANKTAILPVLVALFRSQEFWDSFGLRTKRPLEDVVGTARVLDLPFTGDSKEGLQNLYWQLNGLGHAPLAWAPPNGYPDVTAAWLSAGQMLQRWSVHRALSHGWWKGLKHDKLPADLQPRPAETYRAWFDRLGRRLIGQRFDSRHLDGLEAFVQADLTRRVDVGKMQWQAGHVVALVLDSPAFLVR